MMTDLEFLKQIKEYIETREILIDAEFGDLRSFEQLLKDDDDIPDIYHEAVERITRLKSWSDARLSKWLLKCQLTKKATHAAMGETE